MRLPVRSGSSGSAATEPGEPRTWQLRLDPARIAGPLWMACGAVVALDFAAAIARGRGAPYGLTRFFDGDDKMNVPTGYKIVFLLAVGLLFGVQAMLARRDDDGSAPGWRLLSYAALFAFVDETTYLHQSLSQLMRDHLHLHGALAFAWTLVYAPAALAVAVALLRYWPLVARRTRRPVVLAGALYVAGALLMEPLKSRISDSRGEGSLAFQLVAAVSDSLEILGLTALVVALLTAAAGRVTTASLTVTRLPAEGRQEELDRTR